MPVQEFNFTVYVLRECEYAGVVYGGQDKEGYHYTVGQPPASNLILNGVPSYDYFLSFLGFGSANNVCGPVTSDLKACEDHPLDKEWFFPD